MSSFPSGSPDQAPLQQLLFAARLLAAICAVPIAYVVAMFAGYLLLGASDWLQNLLGIITLKPPPDTHSSLMAILIREFGAPFLGGLGAMAAGISILGPAPRWAQQLIFSLFAATMAWLSVTSAWSLITLGSHEPRIWSIWRVAAPIMATLGAGSYARQVLVDGSGRWRFWTIGRGIFIAVGIASGFITVQTLSRPAASAPSHREPFTNVAEWNGEVASYLDQASEAWQLYVEAAVEMKRGVASGDVELSDIFRAWDSLVNALINSSWNARFAARAVDRLPRDIQIHHRNIERAVGKLAKAMQAWVDMMNDGARKGADTVKPETRRYVREQVEGSVEGLLDALTLAESSSRQRAVVDATAPSRDGTSQGPALPPVATQSAKNVSVPYVDITPGNGILLPHDLELAWVGPHDFTMGSRTTQSHHSPDELAHRVRITRGFWLSIAEVTQGQWRAVMGTAPWAGRDEVVEDDNAAASYISWEDAGEFCRRITERERATRGLQAGWAYRLPTEAEWELACRAGSEAAYSFGDDAKNLSMYAVFSDNRLGDYAHRVKTRLPSAWGFYDMHGNVWEWCADEVDDSLGVGVETYVDGVIDPYGRGGRARIFRGGNWRASEALCRSSYRAARHPTTATSGIGLRIALVEARATGK